MSKFYARCFSLSSFNAFSKRSIASQPWVLVQLASSVSPSSKVTVGLKSSRFRALVVSA